MVLKSNKDQIVSCHCLAEADRVIESARLREKVRVLRQLLTEPSVQQVDVREHHVPLQGDVLFFSKKNTLWF